MRRTQSGVALLVVLWATALLTIMLAAFAVSMRTEGLQARNQFDQVRARYAAEAGIARAVYGMAMPNPKQRWIDDGRPYRFDFGGAKVTVRILSESGKIDLNHADPQLLTGLFRAAGLDPDRAEALSEAVQDWRDADDATRPNGAERAQYREAGRKYGPRNGPFLSIEELQMVLGMTPALYRKVAPAITVWSGRNMPVLGSAPALVLEALPGMDAQRAADYVHQRQQRDSAYDPLPPLPGGVVAMGGGSDSDSVHVVARLPNGTGVALKAVVRRTGNAPNRKPYSVLHWTWSTPGPAAAGGGAGASAGANGGSTRGR